MIRYSLSRTEQHEKIFNSKYPHNPSLITPLTLPNIAEHQPSSPPYSVALRLAASALVRAVINASRPRTRCLRSAGQRKEVSRAVRAGSALLICLRKGSPMFF